MLFRWYYRSRPPEQRQQVHKGNRAADFNTLGKGGTFEPY